MLTMFIVTLTVWLCHPRFVQIRDFLGDQPVVKAALRPTRLNHRSALRVLARRRPAAAAHR
jgi:hypothetical protein